MPVEVGIEPSTPWVEWVLLGIAVLSVLITIGTHLYKYGKFRNAVEEGLRLLRGQIDDLKKEDEKTHADLMQKITDMTLVNDRRFSAKDKGIDELKQMLTQHNSAIQERLMDLTGKVGSIEGQLKNINGDKK